MCLVFIGTLTLSAHPVAQGSLDVFVHPDFIEVNVRASNEEAMVVEALSGAEAGDDGIAGVWKRHGDYLTHHIRVFADEAPLAGTVLRIQPPATLGATDHAEYFLRFDLPTGARPPASVELRQDVMNELEFAPGNKWEATYVAQVAQVGQPARAGLLFTAQAPLVQPCDWGAPVSAAPPVLDRGVVFSEYLRHGVFHILSGYDHVLFMAALVLAVSSLLDLVKVVTAFTIAHTITLSLAVLRLVHVPTHVVEPMIAASIVVVATQNVFWPRQSRGWSRYAVAFGFGLFHGLGFAGGLLQAMSGLPGIAIALAITAFSLGVELGHQAVVLPIFTGLSLARRARNEPAEGGTVRKMAMRYGSAAVCVAGCVYFIAALRHG